MKSKIYPVLILGTAAPFTWANDAPHTLPAETFSQPEKNFDVSPKDALLPAPDHKSSTEVLPDLNEHTLLQQPELLYKALESAVVLNQMAALREVVPIYQKLPENSKYYDGELLALAQAKLNAANGNNAQAVQDYQKVLARYPNLSVVRLDMALNQFHARHDRAAETELRDLQNNHTLPEHIRQGIAPYLAELQARRKWHFYGDANYIRDNNINQSPKIGRVEIGGLYWQAPKAKRAHGIGYRAGASKDTNLRKNFFWRKELDLNGNFYWNAHDYDEINARVSSGIVRMGRKHQTTVSPYYEKGWYAGQPHSQEWGVRVEQQSWLNPRHRLTAAAEVGKETFRRKQLLRDGVSSDVSLNWQFFAKRNQVFSAGYDFSRKQAQDKSDAYRRHGVRVAWSGRWQNGLQHSVSVGVAKRHYQAPDFFNIKRRDREINTQFTLAHQKWQVKGFQPKLVVQWRKRDSNNPLFGFKKSNAFVQIQKSF